MKSMFQNRWIQAAIFIVAVLVAYFINVEVQSYLGREALARTHLSSLTFAEALARSRETGRPVLVDVSAIWCPTCRRLDSEVFANDSVRAVIAEKFVFSRLEYESEEGERFLETYHASGFPALFVIGSDGRVFQRLDVTFDPSAFVGQLRGAAAASPR